MPWCSDERSLPQARISPHSNDSRLNPENEIQMARLPQSIGRKLFGKFSPDRFGYGFDFSKEFPLQHLAAS